MCVCVGEGSGGGVKIFGNVIHCSSTVVKDLILLLFKLYIYSHPPLPLLLIIIIKVVVVVVVVLSQWTHHPDGDRH